MASVVMKPGSAVALADWWHLKRDRKSTRLNSSHGYISYAVFCLKKKRVVSYSAVAIVEHDAPAGDVHAARTFDLDGLTRVGAEVVVMQLAEADGGQRRHSDHVKP